MQISGKIYLFVELQKSQKGDFKTFSCSISHKKEDGTYLNKRVRVVFDTEKFPKEKLNKLEITKCYEVEVAGWIDVRSFINKENKEVRELYFYINEAKFLSQKEVKANSNIEKDLPF